MMLKKRTDNISDKILSGVTWNIIQLAVNKSFAFVIKVILARILLPEEFGVVGMAVVFISFIEVFNEVGIGAALVQRKEENLKKEHFHTAFWTGVGWSTIVYLIVVFVGGPLAARFYDQSILTQIVPVLSLGILSSPINVVHKAQLTRAMDFKKIALISNASVITSGILSLILALSGFGVWALVFNSVATFIVAMPLYFKATKWMPEFIWQKQAFKDVFGFGIYTTGTKLFNNFINQCDYLFIGKLMSAAALGSYTLAFILTDTLRNQVMRVMNTVMYPVYGKKQDDPKTAKNYYLKLVRYNSLVVLPIMLILFVLAEPIITIFFGDKWDDTIIPLKILCVGVMVSSLTNGVSPLIRGLGYASLEFKIQMFKAIFLYVPMIYVGVKYYGLIGAAMAITINKFIFVIISQYLLKRLVGITYADLFRAVKDVVIAGFFSLGIAYILFDVLHINFIFVAGTSIVTFGAIIYMNMGQELKGIIAKIRGKR